jgi:AcrR family transcriptional regulator
MSESREALLAAAAEEFAQFGLHGARIRSIVAKAGVNERMIYHHFGSKEKLYGAVMDDQRLALGALWFPVLEKVGAMAPEAGMRLALQGFFDIMSQRPQAAGLFIQESLTGMYGDLQPTPEQLPAPLRELYERGQREGVFRNDVQFEVAYGVAVGSLMAVAANSTRFTHWLEPKDPAALRAQVVGQFIDGMTGPPAK